MGDNAINKGITIASEPDDTGQGNNTSFPDAVKELGKALHERYPLRTSNLSHRNVKGLIQIDVLNKYMKASFGRDFPALKELQESKIHRTVSVKGWGADKFIEVIKGIQASFEQTELPNRLSQMLRR